jgi:hypothetical protein
MRWNNPGRDNLLTDFRKFEIRISPDLIKLAETNPNIECANDKNRDDAKSWRFLVWVI